MFPPGWPVPDEPVTAWTSGYFPDDGSDEFSAHGRDGVGYVPCSVTASQAGRGWNARAVAMARYQSQMLLDRIAPRLPPNVIAL